MANPTTVNVDLIMSATPNYETTPIMQDNINGTNLVITLFNEDGTDYIPNGLVTFKAVKSDWGTVLQDITTGVSVLGNVVTVTLHEQVHAKTGLVYYQVLVTGGIAVYSQVRYLRVYQGLEEGAIISSNEFTSLANLLLSLEDAETIALAAKELAESTIEEEATRQANELLRQSAEGLRDDAETSRQESYDELKAVIGIPVSDGAGGFTNGKAVNVPIDDTDGNYTAESVEGALAEIGTEITTARGGEANLDARLTGIETDVRRTIDQLEMNTADIAELKSLSTFYDPYNDGLFTDIYGIEVDFSNRKFTRLAGAVGKTPGADFDGILAFGGRRRCNLADNGTVNAYFGDAGYIEDGSNGQVMVEQNKFYYKVVPLKLEKNDEPEITSIKFDTAATDSGNITITLNGVSQNVAVANGDGVNDVATKVRNTNFAGWTTSGSTSTVVFTKNKVGAVTEPTFSGGTTGVTATITRTQAGFIGKGFKLRKARYYVSMTKKAGFKVHPAFVKNGVEVEKIYLSAYEGSLFDVSASAYIQDDAQVADFTVTNGDILSSIANVKPISGNTQDLTRRKCGIIAENRGLGWSQQYAATAACTQLLFTVEYASMNSQTAIGMGVVNKAYVAGQNDSELTGLTANLGNASGMAAGTNGLTSITYRGEENFWGNIFKFTDGMNIFCDIANSVHELYVADNTFAESTQASPYANAGITLATRSGYISAMAYSETYDWLFVPAETLGDSALPVGDYFYQAAATNGYKIALLGGAWDYGSIGGAFCWSVYYAPSGRYASVGGRLVYVPAA